MIIKKVNRPFFEIKKHVELVYETCLLLENDGKKDLSYLINSTVEGKGITYRELLEKGARDSDVPFSGGYICHTSHFHHPWTHCGYLTSYSSADKTADIFTRALDLWKKGHRGEAAYQLGRSLHLVQDIFMPQHAAVTAFNGHSQLETWLTDNWKPYQVTEGGYYHWKKTFISENGKKHHLSSERVYDWIDLGSHLSFKWYQKYFKKRKYNEETFQKVAAQIVPHVLRYSAGYLNKFFFEAETQE